MRSVAEVIDFSKNFRGKTFVIGGASVYASFDGLLDEWFVTDIPETIADADTFMPADFLDDFVLVETINIGEGLIVRRLRRASATVV